MKKKLIAVAAAILMAVSFTLTATSPAEARSGRFVAGLALGLAAAAIIGHHHRRHYSYYPSYYNYDYYPRRHHRHHRRHHPRHRGSSFD